MKFKVPSAALPFCLCGGLALAADKPAVDPLTKLPVPLVDAAFLVYGNPMRLDDFSVCKSAAKMNSYTSRSGKIDAAVAWYASHLSGFKHTHGYASGQHHDTFYNSAGTLFITITGNAAKQSENTDVYSVTYGTLQPGASEKVLMGMNVANIDCG